MWVWKKLIIVNPVNRGYPRERKHMVFIDKWSLCGGYIVLFNKGSLKSGLYLQGGLYLEVILVLYNQWGVTECWPVFTGWSFLRGGL